MSQNRVHPIQIQKVNSHSKEFKNDLLAVEEPLEIKLGFGPKENRQQKSLAVTMRTPGNDQELAMGFTLTEGIIKSFRDVTYINYCKDQEGKTSDNIIRLELDSNVKIDWERMQRHFYTNSSCGICGKASIESLELLNVEPLDQDLTISREIIHSLEGKMRDAQLVFEHTGGLHAAAVFSADGELLLMREDVGRHNALDKLIGAATLKNMDLDQNIILLSGRVSFELVQKALMAKIPFIVAVGAPSSLAVETAKKFNITILGFARNSQFNLYAGEQRLILGKNKVAIEKH